MIPLILLALATPPVTSIPRPIACLIRGGENARVIVVGDSLSNSISGTFYDNGTDRTHFPLNIGFHNVWQPLHGWRGVECSPADGAYKNWRGVACQGWGTQYGPRVDGSDYGGPLGQTIDVAVEGDVRSTLFTQPSELHTSLASAAIGRGDLWVRQVTYDGGWQHTDSPASPFDPDTEPYITLAEDAIFGGTLFYNAASDGMICLSIAQGGDNTLDHLRTSTTYGTTGWYATRERGYHDDGLTSWLTAMDMMEGTPLVVIALGTNIASPDNGGPGESSGGLTTQAYSDNIEAIIERWRTIYSDPYFMLVGMYGFGASPNGFVESRAEWLWRIAEPDDHIAFVNLPAAMDPFDSDWYFNAGTGDYHLSSAGSLEVARIIWDAAGEAVCPADLNCDDALDTYDYFLYLTWYSQQDPRADINHDEDWTSDDFFAYLDLYVEGC